MGRESLLSRRTFGLPSGNWPLIYGPPALFAGGVGLSIASFTSASGSLAITSLAAGVALALLSIVVGRLLPGDLARSETDASSEPYPDGFEAVGEFARGWALAMFKDDPDRDLRVEITVGRLFERLRGNSVPVGELVRQSFTPGLNGHEVGLFEVVQEALESADSIPLQGNVRSLMDARDSEEEMLSQAAGPQGELGPGSLPHIAGNWSIPSLRVAAALEEEATPEELAAVVAALDEASLEVDSSTSFEAKAASNDEWIVIILTALRLKPFLLRLAEVHADDAPSAVKQLINKVTEARSASNKPRGVLVLKSFYEDVEIRLDPDLPDAAIDQLLRGEFPEHASGQLIFDPVA